MLETRKDADYMAVAISLSQRGKGLTTYNPNVACVIVKNDQIIGRGWTQKGGRPHAEAMALEQAGPAAKGADIYVTLEPCAHDSERGPTCSNLLVAAQPKRVIVATLDPDQRTRRLGVDRLGEAGISVSVGILESAARRAMAGFFMRQEKQRPHVTLKLAMSLDGQIAMMDGSSKWITGERARSHGHMERARADAILVGAGTSKADHPSLDVRLDGLEDRSPLPVLLGNADVPDHWVTIESPEAISDLTDVNWLLVEGGAATAASFIKADLVDRLLLYRAPIIVGQGLSAIGDFGLENLENSHDRWHRVDQRQLDQDMLEIYERAA